MTTGNRWPPLYDVDATIDNQAPERRCTPTEQRGETMGGPGWAMRLPPPHRNAATGTWLDCGTTTGCPTLHLVVAANIHPLPKKKGDAAMSLRPKDGWRERGASPSGRECMWVRRCVSRVFLSFF